MLTGDILGRDLIYVVVSVENPKKAYYNLILAVPRSED
jgi:hypothetical protein